MKINYPELIQSNQIELKFAIGDKVKRNFYNKKGKKVFEETFIISYISISPQIGIVYHGLGSVDSSKEKEFYYGEEENLILIEKGVFTKEDIK